MSVRKEPAEGGKATSELAAKKVWPDESKLNATPATLLHRLRGPVTATEPRHDPPRRLNEDGSRGTDYVVGPVDVVVRREGGTEVMADSNGHISLWSFEQRVFDSRKRFQECCENTPGFHLQADWCRCPEVSHLAAWRDQRQLPQPYWHPSHMPHSTGETSQVLGPLGHGTGGWRTPCHYQQGFPRRC